MREAMQKIVIILLLIAIVGLPIVLRPASGETSADENAPRLVIYTPHNEQIRHEMAHGFNDWRVANGLPAIAFDWRTPGGTSDIRKTILDQFAKKLEDDALDEGIGVDLFFGGGDYDHGKIANGIQVGEDSWSPDNRRIVEDPGTNPSLFGAVFPEDEIGGQPLYDTRSFNEDGGETVVAWTGVTLSSFGIVYNNDTLEQLGIDRPMTWEDLADPRLRGWVALADPGHSGSIAQTFNTILKREGWTEGWEILRGVYANARYFATSSDRVPVDVSRGDAAAGMCIDFYGRYQAGKVGDGRMGYTDPIEDGKSMTATTADPITLLRGAPSKDLAQQFIAWLLTPDAQGLWQRAVDPADTDLVRPDRHELRRQPLRRDIYNAKETGYWVDQELAPYDTAVPFPEGTPNYFGMVAPVTKTMAIDVHDDLVRAANAIEKARAINHHNLNAMEARFNLLPEEITLKWPDPTLRQHWHRIHNDPSHPRHDEVVQTLKGFKQQLKDLGDVEAKRVSWRMFFERNYREVVRLGNE